MLAHLIRPLPPRASMVRSEDRTIRGAYAEAFLAAHAEAIPDRTQRVSEVRLYGASPELEAAVIGFGILDPTYSGIRVHQRYALVGDAAGASPFRKPVPRPYCVPLPERLVREQITTATSIDLPVVAALDWAVGGLAGATRIGDVSLRRVSAPPPGRFLRAGRIVRGVSELDGDVLVLDRGLTIQAREVLHEHVGDDLLLWSPAVWQTDGDPDDALQFSGWTRLRIAPGAAYGSYAFPAV
jgi:hypothetical protein